MNWLTTTLREINLRDTQIFGRRKLDYQRRSRNRTRDVVGWIAIFVEVAIVLPSAYVYVTTRDERTKERQYQAWEVVASAHGRGWSGGRDLALEDLNKGGISLRSIDLSGAQMDSLRLPNADLKFAHMDSTSLTGADLHGAKMARTRLRAANLGGANLRDAEFSFAHADHALFVGARLCGALFISTDLRGAEFKQANLRDARFDGADLRGAVFPAEEFESVPPGSSFREANIDGIKASDTFIQQARAMGAVTQSEALWNMYRATHVEDWRIRWLQHDAARIRRGADSGRRCADLRSNSRSAASLRDVKR